MSRHDMDELASEQVRKKILFNVLLNQSPNEEFWTEVWRRHFDKQFDRIKARVKDEEAYLKDFRILKEEGALRKEERKQLENINRIKQTGIKLATLILTNYFDKWEEKVKKEKASFKESEDWRIYKEENRG